MHRAIEAALYFRVKSTPSIRPNSDGQSWNITSAKSNTTQSRLSLDSGLAQGCSGLLKIAQARSWSSSLMVKLMIVIMLPQAARAQLLFRFLAYFSPYSDPKYLLFPSKYQQLYTNAPMAFGELLLG